LQEVPQVGSIADRKFRLKSGERAIIRSAIETDAEQLAQVVGSAAPTELASSNLPGDWGLEGQPDAARMQVRLHRDRPGWLFLVAELNEQVVGAIELQNGVAPLRSHSGRLAMLVSSECRNRGIGAALLQAALDWAKASPIIERVGVSVASTNRKVLHLCRNFGFEPEGRHVRGVKLGPGEYADDVLSYRTV
jgi:RimJ/RimL family protein N-acetyltransferase